MKNHEDLEGVTLVEGKVNFPRPIIDSISETTIEECLFTPVSKGKYHKIVYMI